MNLDIEYSVRRSDRARRARIQVTADGVEVVVPRRLPMREVEPFIAEKQPWIERTLRKIREAEAERPAAELDDGGQVPYLGETLLLRVKVEPGRTPFARRPPRRRARGQGRRRRPRAGGRRARGLVPAPGPARDRAAPGRRLRARAETGYSKLSIRSQRTRWASCSSSGAMSFNWRLLLAPAEVLDYVVEHEVCHLTVHDHSRRFWSLLGARVPDYREHERWLKRHGPSLRLLP